MAAIGSTPFERCDKAEGFLIVTSAADKGLVDIHDRRPLVFSPKAAREWMRQDNGGKEAGEIAADGALPADKFNWHAVTRAVGNVKNQGQELIVPLYILLLISQDEMIHLQNPFQFQNKYMAYSQSNHQDLLTFFSNQNHPHH